MIAALMGLLAAQASSGASAGQTVLVFDFPDGVRGGYGKIQGTAAVPKSQGGLLPAEDSARLLAECGLARPRAPQVMMSHHSYLFGPSTPEDEKIVRCFKSRTMRHFNVGIGKLDDNGFFGPLNDGPFMKFVAGIRE